MNNEASRTATNLVVSAMRHTLLSGRPYPQTAMKKPETRYYNAEVFDLGEPAKRTPFPVTSPEIAKKWCTKNACYPTSMYVIWESETGRTVEHGTIEGIKL